MMDEEIRQVVSEVREMKQMCGNINMKLTNIVTQRGQDIKKKLEAEYQRGLNDAWEAARKIALMDTETSENVTGYFGLFRIMENLTPMQAIEKLKAYEEKQKADDEIKIGDEVETKDGMSIELKPCPFCGGKARLCKFALFSCEAKVMCPTCRIQTATYKESNMNNAKWFAVNAWNRRVTE